MGIEVLTDAQIEALLALPKKLQPPFTPRRKRKAGHFERDFKLKGPDGERFVVFARQNLLIPRSFSVGLKWLAPRGDEFTLMRVNGHHHGPHRNKLEGSVVPAETCHVHTGTERYGQLGTLEHFAEACADYYDLDGALQELGRRCNIRGGPFDYTGQGTFHI
jgi:hypothetical protein